MASALVNSPAINGNIGSCTSQTISTVTGRNLWTENIMNTVTNSCTGEVQEFMTWGLTGISVIGILIMILFVAIFLVVLAD